MTSPVLCLLAILLIASTPEPLPAGGPLWDWLTGVGFVALAFLLALSWEAESPAPQPRLTVHRDLAIAASVFATVHAFGYLLTDPISLEYLLPKAPVHMLVGILGYLALLLVTVSALPVPRRRLYADFPSFRRWHLWLSIAALLASGWHVVGTGFSISGWWRLSAFAALALALPAAAYLARRRQRATTPGPAPESAAIGNRMIALSAFISLLLACLYMAIRNALQRRCCRSLLPTILIDR